MTEVTDPIYGKIDPALNVRNDQMRLSCHCLLVCEGETVRSVGEYVHLEGNLAFCVRIREEKRVLYGNTFIGKGMPEEDGRGGLVNVHFEREAEVFRIGWGFRIAEVVEGALVREFP